jgi:hypothetical protein
MALANREIEQLLSLRELSTALRKSGRMVRSESTLKRYVKIGVEGPDGKAVRLHCVRMNGVHRTCLKWFDEFLMQLEDYGSCVP